MALAIPAILSVLYIGPYSDRGGRKVPILMSSVGLMLNAGVTGTFTYISNKKAESLRPL